MASVKRWVRRGLAAAGGGAVVLAAWVGWLTPVQAWEEATGWSRIPESERPTTSVLWTSDGAPAPDLAWLGHAGFVLRWHGLTVLFDPNTNTRCTLAKRILEPVPPMADLGPVDLVVVSHAHYDHLDLPTLAATAEIGAIVLPQGSEDYLPEDLRRRARVVPLGLDERAEIGPLAIVGVKALHNGNRFHPLRSDQLALGYVVSDGDDALFVAGDTGYGPHLADIGRRFHPRAAILPIGAYSPRLILKPYHLNPEEAVTAARDLGVETAVPGHFGTFTLFLDRPSSALPRFAAAAHAAGQGWMLAPLLRAPREDA